MNRQVNTDLWSGVIGLAVAGIFGWGRGEVGRLSIMFPNALLVFLALFSIALVVKGIARPDRRPIFAEGDRGKIVGSCAILFAWAIAIPYIGFVLASIAGFWGMTCYLASSRRKVTPQLAAKWLFVALVVVALFYLVFAKLLYVPLPKGSLFD